MSQTRPMPDGPANVVATQVRRHARMVGLSLTWLGGTLALVLLIPVLGLTILAREMASEGDREVQDSLVCGSQVCISEMTAWTLAGVGVTVLTLSVVALVVRSTTRALVLATVFSTGALVAIVGFGAEVWALQPYPQVMAGLTVVALAPSCLALGSILRLRSR